MEYNNQQLHDFDKQLPYNITVGRKTKEFFMGPFTNLTKAAVSKNYADTVESAAHSKPFNLLDSERMVELPTKERSARE